MTTPPHDEKAAKEAKAASKELTQVLSLQMPPNEAEELASVFGVLNDPVGLRDHLLQDDVNVPPCLEYGLAAMAGVDLDTVYIEHMIVAARYFRAKGAVDPDRANTVFHLPSDYFSGLNPAVTANFTDIQIVEFVDNYEKMVDLMAPVAAGHLAVSQLLGDEYDEEAAGYASEQD